MADDAVSVSFGADTGSLVGGVDQVNSKLGEVKDGVDRVGESFGNLNELIGLLKLDFLYEQFKKVIEAGEQWTTQVRTMSMQLGLSAEAASGLSGALGIIGVSSETYASAAMKLDRQIRTNEEGVNKLGVTTRDVSTGALLPQQQIMLNAIGTLNEYKAGTDRNLAAQILFGRGVGNLTDLLRLNSDKIREGTEYVQGLGLAMDDEGVAASIHYKEELNKLHLVMVSIEKQITEAVLPALIKMGEWFNSVGPAAIGKTIDKVQEYARALGSLYALIASAGDPDLRAAVDDEISDRANGATAPATTTSTASQTAAGTRTFPDDLLKGGGQDTEDNTDLQIERDNVKTQEELAKIGLQTKKDVFQQEVDAHQITKKQEVDQLKTFADQEYQISLDALNKEAALYDEDSADYNRVQNQILVLKAQHEEEMQKLTLQSVQAQMQADKQLEEGYKKTFDGVTGAFDQMLGGVLQGTQTWQAALQKLFSNMAATFVESLAKMALQWAAFEASTSAGWTKIAAGIGNPFSAAGSAGAASSGQQSTLAALLTALTGNTAAQTAGTAAATLSTTATAANTTTQVAQVGQNSVETVSNTAAIVANTAAQGTAGGGGLFGFLMSKIPSLDVGSWSIPSDTLAMVHQGEMILPANVASGVRSGAGSASLAGGSGGDNYSVTINAVDSQSFANLMQSPQGQKAIVQIISQQARANNRTLMNAVGAKAS